MNYAETKDDQETQDLQAQAKIGPVFSPPKEEGNTLLFFLLPSLFLFIGLFLRNGWIEQDTYAFFGKYCQNGISITVPYLSDKIFSLLPCDLTIWFIFQSILWGATIYLFLYALKKYFNINPGIIGLFAFSFGFMYAFMALEDDYLVTGLIFLLTLWLFHRPTWSKRIIYGLFTIVFFEFFWHGAGLVMPIFLFGSIVPYFAFLPVIAYIFQTGFGGWGNSIEADFGASVITLVPLAILLGLNHVDKMKEFIHNNRGLFYTSIATFALGTFQQKWGLYTMILFPILFWKTMPENHRKKILISGFFLLLIVPSMLLLTKPPQENHWNVIHTAVEYQKKGLLVYNDRGVRWLFQFAGGSVNDQGDYTTSVDFKGHFYWLGFDNHCRTIISADDLYFQECNK